MGTESYGPRLGGDETASKRGLHDPDTRSCRDHTHHYLHDRDEDPEMDRWHASLDSWKVDDRMSPMFMHPTREHPVPLHRNLDPDVSTSELDTGTCTEPGITGDRDETILPRRQRSSEDS